MSIPRTDIELAVWFKNFAQSFATHAPTLGFTPAEVAAVQADAAMLDFAINDLLPTYQSAVSARVAFKNLLKDGPLGAPGGDLPPAPVVGTAPATVAPGIIPRLRQLLQRIKVAPAYTEDIGQDLGIAGKEGGNSPDDDPTTAKPTVNAVALPASQVRIEFNKRNFDGVFIEGRRTGEEEWVSLGTDNYSPYIDTRPPLQAGKAEVREYRLRFIQRDEAVGEWSDIISASTQP